MIKVGDETKQIIEALISVTDKMQAEKDGKNPHFRSDYMTLDGILNTVKPILKEAGIAIVQSVDTTEDDKIRCYTRLIHKSGEYLQGESVVHADKMTPQGFGSAITYARRYGITSLLSIAEPDDDGNAAEAATKAPAKKKSETVTSTKLPQDAIDKVVTAFNMSGIKEELLEKKYGVSSNWTTATRKEMLQAFDKLKAGEINSEFFLANK